MDKRDALKKEELIAAIKRSDKTYEEILNSSIAIYRTCTPANTFLVGVHSF